MGDTSGGAAAVARGAKGKLRPRPAREYIVVVGGCVNTFNNWVSLVTKPGSADYAYIGGAPPRNRGEIGTYIGFAPERVDLDAIPEDQWRRHGWFRGSYQTMKDKGWKPTEVNASRTETHDLYWGNFVTPASRIFNSDEPWPEPLRRPSPAAGDIVTFLVFVPSYESRARVDWAASPYNSAHRDKFEAAKYWGTESEHRAPAEPVGFVSPEEKQRKKEEAKERAKAKAADMSRPLSEEDINFYILVRTTDDNTEDYIKKPARPDAYLEYIYRRLLQSVKADGVMTKVLLFRTEQQLVDYVDSGRWSGSPWDTFAGDRNWDEPPEDEPAADDSVDDQNFAFTPPRPVKKDASGRPLKWPLPWYPAWEKTPSVNRHVVKVARFDYIGHSDPDQMMVSYGWDCAKGYEALESPSPVPDVYLKWLQMDECFGCGALAHDAFAMLWGCNLGAAADLGDGKPWTMAGCLAQEFFGGGVVAAASRTTFEQVTTGPSKMPVPVDGQPWVYFPHKAGGAKLSVPEGMPDWARFNESGY